MTRNIVAEKYWLIEFFTMNVKLQNENTHKLRYRYMVVREHSPKHLSCMPSRTGKNVQLEGLKQNMGIFVG